VANKNLLHSLEMLHVVINIHPRKTEQQKVPLTEEIAIDVTSVKQDGGRMTTL
jgi:hypothetical protein